MAVKRTYPHVPNVKDPSTQQSLRLLWDRIWDLTDNVDTANTNITAAQSNITTLQTDATDLKSRVKKNALVGAVNQQGQATTPGTTPPPVSDNGQGQLGCSEAGSTGFLTAPFPLTAESVGKIVCGTGNEFPDLEAPTVDLATRQTNQDTLLKHMVYRLNQQGFPCAQYPAPVNSAARLYVLVIGINGDGYTYRVFEYADFTNPLQTVMVLGHIVPGQPPSPDPGLP